MSAPNQRPVDIQANLEELNEQLPGYYRHYKGGLYHVKCAAFHTETKDYLMVYQHISGVVYVRPPNMFIEQLELNAHQSIYRFRFLTGYERLQARVSFFFANLF